MPAYARILSGESKRVEIPDLSEDHRAHAVTDTGDRQDGRMKSHP